MRRRDFIAGVGGAAAWPLAARAQPTGKAHRVGLVFSTAPMSTMAGPDPINLAVRAFVHGLRDLGYVEGRNLVVERRSAEGRFERFGEIVAELVALNVDAIVITGALELARAAKRLTSTVPIVMASSFNPVEEGLVASLARPGGNITGLTHHAGPEIEAKRLQLLKEAVPQATRIAFLGLQSLWDGAEGNSVRAAAPTFGVALIHAGYTPTDYTGAFALITRERPHALFVARHGSNNANGQRIADFALEQRLPSVFPYRESVEAGGLLSYGASVPDLYRRAAGHVDKILKGAKPADLAVEQPTKFELVINLKTARTLGLSVPPIVLAQADEVIE